MIHQRAPSREFGGRTLDGSQDILNGFARAVLSAEGTALSHRPDRRAGLRPAAGARPRGHAVPRLIGLHPSCWSQRPRFTWASCLEC